MGYKPREPNESVCDVRDGIVCSIEDLQARPRRKVQRLMAPECSGLSPQAESAAVEARIAGRVQGIGFRYFAFEEARRLGLVGYVRNTRDGGVRVYAEGPRGRLEQFLRALEQGPQGSRVREVRVSWSAGTGSYSTFSIESTL